MDNQTRLLIQARAERLFPIVREELMADQANFEFGETFRYCFLVLRKPRAFLAAFREGALKIDLAAVEDIFWSFRQEIPGSEGLLHQEREIIGEHNRAVDAFVSEQPATRSLGMRTVIGLATSDRYRFG